MHCVGTWTLREGSVSAVSRYIEVSGFREWAHFQVLGHGHMYVCIYMPYYVMICLIYVLS